MPNLAHPLLQPQLRIISYKNITQVFILPTYILNFVHFYFRCEKIPRRKCKTSFNEKCHKKKKCTTEYEEKCKSIPKKVCKDIKVSSKFFLFNFQYSNYMYEHNTYLHNNFRITKGIPEMSIKRYTYLQQYCEIICIIFDEFLHLYVLYK